MGTDSSPIPDAVVLVAEGKISSAGPRTEVEIPVGAETVDATGKTVIPGLIDLHSHYSPFRPDPDRVKRELAAQLAFGITTARSPWLNQPATMAVFDEVKGRLMGHVCSPAV